MTSRWVTTFFLIALTAKTFAGALDAPHQELLGARAAGMGGFEAAGGAGLEALLYNPAGLPDSGLHAGAFSAFDPAQRGQVGFGLSAPVDDTLRVGLLYGGLQDSQLQALQSHTLALVGAAELQPGVSLGVRGQLHQLQASALEAPVRGGSLDLGWQARALRAPWIPGYWSLGLNGDHLLGFWPDTAWAQALPMAGRAAMAYRPWPALSLGVQMDWVSAAQLAKGSAQTWRSGLQWSPWPTVALRAGWNDNGQQGAISAGTGLEFPSVGTGLDYALIYGPNGETLSHRLALRWMWAMEPHADMRIKVTQLLIEPESGVVRSARFDIRLSPLLRQRNWHVELKDEQGQVLRTLTPIDRQDATVTWDGRDDQGRQRPLPPGVRAELVASGDKGSLRHISEETLEQSAKQQELARVEQGPATQATNLAAPTFQPVFDDAKGTKLSHVLIALPSVKARNWSLDIQDSRERSLRKLGGSGDLPDNLVWDGRDEQGRKVEDALNVQVKLSVEDLQGKQAVQMQPLFSQQAFAMAHQEARQRPELRLASLGLPLLMGRPALTWMENFLATLSEGARRRVRVANALKDSQEAQAYRQRYLREGVDVIEVDLFAEDSSKVLTERKELLDAVDRRLKRGQSTVWVTGLARKDEKNPTALARRRALAMAQQLEQHGEGVQIVVESSEKVGDFKGVHLEFR